MITAEKHIDSEKEVLREYRYRVRWSDIVAGVLLFGLCAAVAAYEVWADRPPEWLLLFLPRLWCHILQGLLSLALLALAVGYIYQGYVRCQLRPRVMVLADAIVLPVIRWGRYREAIIFLDDLKLVDARQHDGYSDLYIHADNSRFKLQSFMFATAMEYVEFLTFVREECAEARANRGKMAAVLNGR